MITLNKKILLALLLILGVGATIFYIKNKTISSSLSPDLQAEADPFPWLNLPSNVFSENNVKWGAMQKISSENSNDWIQAAFDSKTVYQSYPTTNFQIKNYSSEIRPLKVKTFQGLMGEFSELDPDLFGKSIVEENFQKYGALATNYLPKEHIQSIAYFDVDDDGKAETVVTYNIVARADSGSYHSDIIKGKNIIFSVQEDNAGIFPADTTNGFYVEWRSPEEEGARCCQEGFTRTRFIFKDGEFLPIYEQEVKYIKVGEEK